MFVSVSAMAFMVGSVQEFNEKENSRLKGDAS